MAEIIEISAPAEAENPLLGIVPLGYAALIAHYKLKCPAPRRMLGIAAGRQRVIVPTLGAEWLLLPRSSGPRVPKTPIQHLAVALKHEGVDLRVMAALFRQRIQEEMAAWIAASPRGQYVRRAWFFYEWLTGDRLPVEPLQAVAYVPALDLTDMPDRLSSLFIQFCHQNGGRLSAKKRADYFPAMDDGLLARLETEVQVSFAVD